MMSNYENGTTSIRVDDLPAFAQALGIHPAYFFVNDVFYPVYDEHGNELEERAEPELVPNGILRHGDFSDEDLEGLIGKYVKQLTKRGKRRVVRLVLALVQDELDEMYRANLEGVIKLVVQTPDAPPQ